MESQLYHRIQSGKRVSYKPVPLQSAKLDEGMTSGEIITAVATLAVLAINGYQVMLPEGKCVTNRVKGVQEAVLKMYKDTGTTTENSIVQQVTEVWNETMLRLSGRMNI